MSRAETGLWTVDIFGMCIDYAWIMSLSTKKLLIAGKDRIDLINIFNTFNMLREMDKREN